MSIPKVLFYVQHLLGIGHLRRTATLARNMVRSGLDVTVVSGGHRIDIDLGGARLEQLPATRATPIFFKELVDEAGLLMDERWKQQRANRLMEIFRGLSPDILIFELFPFGRRQMRFELNPLLEAVKNSVNKPVIVSSVRDILVAQKKPGRNDEMLKIVEDYFDHVMVHGDPDLISPDKTFPHSSRISNKLHYIGYVVGRTGQRLGEGHDGYDEVIVSSGGGAVGFNLLKIAMQARALSATSDRTWRILIGAAAEEEEFVELKYLATEGIIVERVRHDFTSLLMNCALSSGIPGTQYVISVRQRILVPGIIPSPVNIIDKESIMARMARMARVVVTGISIFANGGRAIYGRVGFPHSRWTIIIFIQRSGILS